MVNSRNAESLTKHRRGTDGKCVLVSIKVRRSDRLVRVLFEFTLILIKDRRGDVARRPDRRWQLSLRSLVENYRQVIPQVEPRPVRPNDRKASRVRRKQRSRNEIILGFRSQIKPRTRKDSYLMREGVSSETQVEVRKGKTRLKSLLELRLRLSALMTYIGQIEGQDSADRGE